MPRAGVIGGSLGGLFAGNLLHDLGWEVDIYERVPDDLASRGAGIGTHRELLSVLAGLRLGLAERPLWAGRSTSARASPTPSPRAARASARTGSCSRFSPGSGSNWRSGSAPRWAT